MLAFSVDALVVAGAVQLAARRFARTRRGRLLATATLGGTIGVPYHVVLEGAYGRTVGKAMVGVVVATEDGGRPTYAAVTVRTLLRLVDWLPIGYLLGLSTIALTERDQRLGDLVAGTVVERDE